MLSKKFFGGCVKLEPIFRLGEAMALVGEEHVLVIDALALHSLDNLFRLRLFYTRVICPLTNQDRYFDLIDPEQWRTRIRNSSSVSGLPTRVWKVARKVDQYGGIGLLN